MKCSRARRSCCACPVVGHTRPAAASRPPVGGEVAPVRVVLPPSRLLVARLRDGRGGRRIVDLERARQLRLEGAQGGPPLLHAHAAVRALAAVEQRLVALGVAAEEDALVREQEGRPRERERVRARPHVVDGLEPRQEGVVRLLAREAGQAEVAAQRVELEVEGDDWRRVVQLGQLSDRGKLGARDAEDDVGRGPGRGLDSRVGGLDQRGQEAERRRLRVAARKGPQPHARRRLRVAQILGRAHALGGVGESDGDRLVGRGVEDAVEPLRVLKHQLQVRREQVVCRDCRVFQL
mmetsp:Transcript_41147/g.136354  ORF Transcript_41147/g.136354 Transcript_41147/m.136354 type:complete len:293 (+) Transcript_41147:766-1644(+)